jgi:hypothetical protein
MRRLPLTLRALALLPMVALVDQARATVLCGAHAASCLEAAGEGPVGSAGAPLLLALGLLLALALARAVHGGFRRRWATATLAVWGACGLWAVACSGLDGGVALGGGWIGLLALGMAAGALLALLLRAAPAASRLLRSSLGAPRALLLETSPRVRGSRRGLRRSDAQARLARGRAPPALA